MKYSLVILLTLLFECDLAAQSLEHPNTSAPMTQWLSLGIGYEFALFQAPTYEAGLFYSHARTEHEQYGCRIVYCMASLTWGPYSPPAGHYWTRLDLIEAAALYGYRWKFDNVIASVSGGVSFIGDHYSPSSSDLKRSYPDDFKNKFSIGLPLQMEYLVRVTTHTGFDLIAFYDLNRINTILGISANIVWIL